MKSISPLHVPTKTRRLVSAWICPGRNDAVLERISEFEDMFDLPLTRVGRVEEGSGVDWIDGSGGTLWLPAGGFDHFSD